MMDQMAVLAWMVLLVTLVLWDRLDRLALKVSREPTEHPELLVLLAWMVAMGPTGSLALSVPLALLAHRGHKARKVSPAKPGPTVPPAPTEPTGPMAPMEPKGPMGPLPSSDRSLSPQVTHALVAAHVLSTGPTGTPMERSGTEKIRVLWPSARRTAAGTPVEERVVSAGPGSPVPLAGVPM
jgi:hypothetical protein